MIFRNPFLQKELLYNFMLFLQCMFFLIIIEVKSNSVYLLVPIVLMQVRILIHAAAELIYG